MRQLTRKYLSTVNDTQTKIAIQKKIVSVLSSLLMHVFDERCFSGDQFMNSRSAIFQLLDVPLNEWFQLEASDATVTAWTVTTPYLYSAYPNRLWRHGP